MASPKRLSRVLTIAAAVFSIGAMVGVDLAEARAGRSGSMGSRGSRTYDAPAQTPTAPTARPMERTTQQPGATTAQPGVNRPGAVAPGAAARPASRFGGGFMAGLLGAGLLGALFGAGFFGGLGSLTAILGLLLQVALIGGVIFLAIRFFRSRQQPAYAQGPAQRNAHDPMGGRDAPPSGGAQTYGAMGGAAAGSMTADAAPEMAPLELMPADFDAFEKLLGDVQAAYGEGGVGKLRMLTTPEMASYFEDQISEDERRGVKAKVSDVKLLQGDLSEAWREGRDDFATVAMRFALKEGVIDRATGRVVEGDPERLTEATEIWTFRREQGHEWRLSGIQQT
jgi:predicted lipid-binding transport protein (Tim44 family)